MLNVLPKNYTEPKKCDLCSKKILDEEIYYIGVTRGKIWANTCSEFECYKWLTHKLKFKIPWKEPKK